MKEYKITCLEGELEGAEIIMQPGDRIIVGREPRFANLVFRDMTISRKHCMIELDEQGDYYVTDYSECGLLTDDGIIFENSFRTKCSGGSVLVVGKAGTRIQLNQKEQS